MTFREMLAAAFEIRAEAQSAQDQKKMQEGGYDHITFSNHFKRKMNRMFRERAGAQNDIPHPEVDNGYERLRSRIVCFFLHTRTESHK